MPVALALHVNMLSTCKHLLEFDTCVWFPQVRGSGFMAAAEASSFLKRSRGSCPPLGLLRVRVAALTAYDARLALTCGLCVVTCLPL